MDTLEAYLDGDFVLDTKLSIRKTSNVSKHSSKHRRTCPQCSKHVKCARHGGDNNTVVERVCHREGPNLESDPWDIWDYYDAQYEQKVALLQRDYNERRRRGIFCVWGANGKVIKDHDVGRI